MNKKITNWIGSLTDSISERDLNLIRRAANTIENNIFKGEKFPWEPYVCISPGLENFDGIWNWDSAFHAMAVAYWDCDLAKDSIYGFFKFQDEKGMLPDVVWKNGTVVNQFTKPPVFAQAVKRVFSKCGDREFIKIMYPKLYNNAKFWENIVCMMDCFIMMHLTKKSRITYKMRNLNQVGMTL